MDETINKKKGSYPLLLYNVGNNVSYGNTHILRCLKASGHNAILSATMLQPLHFGFFPDAHLVPDEVTPYRRQYALSSLFCITSDAKKPFFFAPCFFG